jgi:hypothetical protein
MAKAEVPLPVGVAPAKAIQANNTPETKGGPKVESPPPVAVVSPQEIEPQQTTGTEEKPKAEFTRAGSSTSVTYPFSLYLGSVPHLDQAKQGVLKYTRKELPVYYTEVALSKSPLSACVWG